MSQRTAKVESLIQQVVAMAVMEEFGAEAANVTVTGVDVAPDLRNAIVWFGLLGDDTKQIETMKALGARRLDIQEALAGQMNTKYVPHLHFRRDEGGEYAAEIDRLLRNL